MKNYLPQITLSIASILFLFLPLRADCLYGNYYVKATATGTGDGSSWANAFTDLQAAIDAAAVGDVICVAAGTYLPTHLHLGDSLRNATFYINKDITLLGGFSGEPGTEGTLAGRDPKVHLTILSGDLGIPNDSLDNAFHVVFIDHVSDTMHLDGFIIRGGNGVNGAGLESVGNGILNLGDSGRSNPQILNCIIRDNFSTESGCGMYNSAANGGHANPLLQNCSFINNQGSGGGAMFNGADTGGEANPTLINCFLIGNAARTADGGAITCVANDATSSALLINCVVTGNFSPNGSAFNTFGTGTGVMSPVFINCVFSGNSGGSVRVVDLGDPNSVITIRNSIFYGNSTGHGITTNGATEDIQYSFIQFGFEGEGNHFEDPQFVSPPPVLGEAHTLGDVHLLHSSTAIDAGNNSFVPAGVTTDSDGKNRFIDPNTGLTGTVDVGPYEVQTFPVSTSVAPFAAQWTCYPNPAQNHLTISLPNSAGQFEYVLWNSSGTIAQRQILQEGQPITTLQVNTLPRGTYFLSLSKDGYTDTRVVTIQ
jgi:hypothetical protein